MSSWLARLLVFAASGVCALLAGASRVNFVLYSSADSESKPVLSFSQNAGGWISDIRGASGDQVWARVCVQGTWLIYRNAGWLASNLSDVTLFTSEKLACAPFSEFEGGVGSAQFLNTDGKLGADTLSAFPFPNFNGVAQPKASSGYVQSVATVGKQKWGVRLQEPDQVAVTQVCLVPPQDGTPVCLMSHFADGDHLRKGVIVELKSNCDNVPEDKHVTLQVCHDLGKGRVHPVEPSSPTFGEAGDAPEEPEVVEQGPTAAAGTCVLEDTSAILSDEQVELLMGRLDGTLSGGDPLASQLSTLQLPNNLIWIQDLFFKCLRVFQQVCSVKEGNLLDPEYFNLFAGLYLYHYGKFAEVAEGLVETANRIPQEEWRELLGDMDRCAIGVVEGNEFDIIGSLTLSAFRTYESLEELEKVVEEWLGDLREELDHVMEINWLMLNTVASVCFRVLKGDSDFLSRLLNVYLPFFLVPAEMQCRQPGNFTDLYDHLFGGYGKHKSILKLGYCTGTAIAYAQLVGHYPRPFDIADTSILAADKPPSS